MNQGLFLLALNRETLLGFSSSCGTSFSCTSPIIFGFSTMASRSTIMPEKAVFTVLVFGLLKGKVLGAAGSAGKSKCTCFFSFFCSGTACFSVILLLLTGATVVLL